MAGLFGIQREGPTTIARRHTSGTLALVQSGTALTGVSIVTAHECVTRGGQVFQDPLIFVPNGVTGQVSGRRVALSLDGPVVDCVWQAVVTGFSAISRVS